MINSYKQVFGAPQGEVNEEDAEMASELFRTFDAHASREKNVESMHDALIRDHKASFDAINDNGKAHVLQLCFHNANENFYELEDEGIIDDCYEAQEEFLACVVEVLKLR